MYNKIFAAISMITLIFTAIPGCEIPDDLEIPADLEILEIAIPAWAWLNSMIETETKSEIKTNADYITEPDKPDEIIPPPQINDSDEPDDPGEPQTEDGPENLVYKELVFFAQQFYNPALFEPGEKLVALTFDDGPGIFTDELLDLLEEHESKATFFVVGSRIAAHPQTLRRMIEQGSEVAGHSWNHPNYLSIEEDEIKFQLQATNSMIFNVTGVRPLMHRVPGGAFDDLVLDVSRELGMSVIQWSLDPWDWRVRNADIVYDDIMSRVRNGSIVVLHDIHAATIEAMERLIPDLIEAEFKLVTVSELLQETGMEPGVVYYSR